VHDYELMYIVRPDVDDERLTATIQRVLGYLTDRGGQIKKETAWGRKRLAYPVQDFREGLYQIVEFDLNPAQEAAVERQLQLTEEIIRFQIIRPGKPNLPPPPRIREVGPGRMNQHVDGMAAGRPDRY